MNQADGMQLKNNSEFTTISKEDPAMRNVQAIRVQDQSTDVISSNPQRDLLNATPVTNINVAQMAVQGTKVPMTASNPQSTMEPVTNLKPVSMAPYEEHVQEAPIQQLPVEPVVSMQPSMSNQTPVEDEMIYNPQMAILNGTVAQEPAMGNIAPVMQSTVNPTPLPMQPTINPVPIQPAINPVPMQPSDIENMNQSPMNIFQTPQVPIEPAPFVSSQPSMPSQSPQMVQTPAVNLNGNMIQPSQRELANKQSPITDGFKRCPKCGAKVAAHLETCFLCGERF